MEGCTDEQLASQTKVPYNRSPKPFTQAEVDSGDVHQCAYTYGRHVAEFCICKNDEFCDEDKGKDDRGAARRLRRRELGRQPVLEREFEEEVDVFGRPDADRVRRALRQFGEGGLLHVHAERDVRQRVCPSGEVHPLVQFGERRDRLVTNPPNSGKSQTADCDGEGQWWRLRQKRRSRARRGSTTKGHWFSSTKHIAYGPAGQAIEACAAWCTSALFSGDDETCAVADAVLGGQVSMEVRCGFKSDKAGDTSSGKCAVVAGLWEELSTVTVNPRRGSPLTRLTCVDRVCVCDKYSSTCV